ncbi:MAG: DNA topoisomerase (ATP-hydrolyzing) subunit A [Chlamydiales bacterium]
MSFSEEETIQIRNLEDEMKESYLRYSMSVIISRALPDVRDGLKPSQRRILYAMRALNLTPGAKYRKCAKISGDTSGDYHPHGETVIYPTLVRLAQDWAMRYPLIDGQGNFGSIDGDPPAAMRYTEARLTSSAVELMEDLDKETVDLIPNYDETRVEPVVFPAKFPNLLSNGSSGIAVGMATNIPPHNLDELIAATILLLENKEVGINEILQVMPGPDFPTGGVICGYKGIHEAYHTGRGKLIVRGALRIEERSDAPERQTIVIDEIPYNVNKSRLIEQIAGLVNSKTVTAVSNVRDESDKEGLRIVLELKRGELPDVVINQLYRFTDLQVTFGCNMLALDKQLPRTMNIKQMISAWIYHRIEVVRRRTRFELNKAEARAHVLEGYLKAISHLDEVVRIIRASQNKEEARNALMSQYQLSERQANAVLDLRLYQLTGLEREKIEHEYEELLKKIERYQAILGSEELVRGIIREELLSVQKGKKSPRRTKIVPAEEEFNVEDLIVDEPVIITVSEDDYVKRMPINLFREQKRGGQGVIGFDIRREMNTLKGIYVASTHDYLLLFTNQGRCYWLKVWQLTEGDRRSKGKPLINLLEDINPEERIATILSTRDFAEERYVLIATAKGIVKKTSLAAFGNPRRKGIRAQEVDEGDELIGARIVSGDEQVMLFTRHGMAVRFDHNMVRPMGRTARGVKGVSLKAEGDRVVSCEVIKSEEETILIVCEKGYGKRSYVSDFRQTNRGGVGVRSIITSERNGKVVGALVVSNSDGVVLMSGLGQTIRIAMQDLRVMGRATQGVRLVNIKEEDILLGMEKLQGVIEKEEEIGAADQ